jgi:diguanylate cyclase (GGDEF)-like protein/PAS domain S-box-containing protein
MSRLVESISSGGKRPQRPTETASVASLSAQNAAIAMMNVHPSGTDEDERALLRALIDQVPDLLFVKDRECRFVLANDATARDLGQTTPDALIGKTDLDFYDEPLARKYLRQEHDIMFNGLSFVDIEERSWDRSAAEAWFSVTKLPLRNADGAVIGLVGCCRDITQRKREERLHSGESAILERITGNAELGEVLDTLLLLVEAECPGIKASLLVTDEEGAQLKASAAPSLPRSWIAELKLVPIAEGVGSCGTAAFRRAPVIVTDVETDPLWRNHRDAIRPYGLRACWSWPILAADGAVLGTSAMYCAEARAPSAIETRLAAFTTHIAGIAIQRKQSEDRIRFLAQNDALTGLPNRFRIEPTIDHAVRNAAQVMAELAVVFIDVDGFKNVNDDLGHRAGDAVLKIIADRLLSILGPRESAARFSGDEFVVLLREAGLASGVTLARVGALRAAIGAPIAIDGKVFHLTTSMGVAHYPRDGATAAALIANADAALFRAQELGRDNAQFFTDEMKAGLEGRLFRQEEIRRGLREDEFLLHYQPQVSLKTGRLVGVEALVRWQHPQLGLLGPGEFVPLAEQTGLIVLLGDWVLRTACRQNKAWQQAGLSPVTVSVNVSARQFRERDWVGQVAAALAESDLAPSWLELELTESLIMQDPRQAIATMQELRDLGVHIAIDDFGTGYSNLSSLKTFPISRLKIDQSFVRGLPEAVGDAAITGAVISLGHQLGLGVMAEGVETAEQMAFLRDAGCDDVQGYVIGRPLPAADLAERLAGGPPPLRA